MARRRSAFDPFDRGSLLKSLGLHVALIAIAVVSSVLSGPPEIEFIAYEIEIVSPPPSQVAEEIVEATEELVVETPDPEPLPPEPEPEEIVPVEEEVPEPEPDPEPEDAAEETPPEAAEETVVAAAPEDEAVEESDESGVGVEVRMAGLRRDYPEYYENIIIQIQRCFRPPQGQNRQAVLFFYIKRDGTVEDTSFDERSGSPAFDFQAMEAVECAGSRARFGPLPDDLPYERFPIRFTFRPRGDEVTPTR
ncbi:MAG: TonB C-terminal domain-containing protein [Gemmatimonadota bacterium]